MCKREGGEKGREVSVRGYGIGRKEVCLLL